MEKCGLALVGMREWCRWALIGVTPSSQISSSGFVTEERACEIEQFFADNPWPVADRIVKQNCEAIRLSAKWLERDREAVKNYLTSR